MCQCVNVTMKIQPGALKIFWQRYGGSAKNFSILVEKEVLRLDPNQTLCTQSSTVTIIAYYSIGVNNKQSESFKAIKLNKFEQFVSDFPIT